MGGRVEWQFDKAWQRLLSVSLCQLPYVFYGGTAHKGSNSTSKGFLRMYIFQCHFAKASKQNKPNKGFNTRSSQVLRQPKVSLTNAITIFIGYTSVNYRVCYVKFLKNVQTSGRAKSSSDFSSYGTKIWLDRGWVSIGAQIREVERKLPRTTFCTLQSQCLIAPLDFYSPRQGCSIVLVSTRATHWYLCSMIC
jgi:hypothetical protein